MQGIAFGQTIRLLRQAKGISLREMARKLGVSPAFLSQIEAGRQHKIPKARIVQVAEMLGVSEGYLLGTARRIHPDVVDFLRETPEAAEFMITAMRSGMVAEDFAELREAVKARGGKGAVRRAKLPGTGKRRISSRKRQAEDLEAYLDPALCLTGVTVQNKDRLFRRFVKLLAKKNKSISADNVLDRLNFRERQAPTNVGGGVAIPHAFLNELERPLVGALSLKRAILYDGTSDEKVKTVFFLIGDESRPKNHISMLARIARLCSSQDFLEAFGKTRTNRELYKTILQWDKRIGS
ncbi:MAG: PTS transporter subunit EIIA [Candidatus Latescibacteria bacterium]|nr:PTS transporter subunit EIIA [Candidatus Latescibacterota bacterium]